MAVKTNSFFSDFIGSLKFLRYCTKIAPLFVNKATLLKMSLDVIEYHLVTAPQGCYPLAHDHRVLTTLEKLRIGIPFDTL
jgi:hypothetical protein